ncbi:hypothetical protein EK21DRAFT_63591, partial [Setomelanomma holmii]
GAMFDRDYGLEGGLCMTPYSAARSDRGTCSNGSLAYPQSASQGLAENGFIRYGGPSSWSLQYPNGLPCNMSAAGSDPESISSLSPKSYTSDTLASEVLPYTPDTSNDGASSSGSWERFHASSYPANKASSPEYPVTMEIMSSARGPQLSPTNLGTANTSSAAGAIHTYGLPSPYDGASRFESEYSCSQNSSPGSSPSYTPGMPYSQAAMASRADESQSGRPFHGLPNPYQPYGNNSMPQQVAAWLGAGTKASSRQHFQVSRPADSQAQRKADDQILLEGKRSGLTYKEISKKMTVKCAESTLRGRYRSLTKARKDRQLNIRRLTLILTITKIKLMNQFVDDELHRIDAHQHMTLSYDQRLAKVPWKKVADRIYAKGGSYHFGNSTCKRKYTELHPSP